MLKSPTYPGFLRKENADDKDMRRQLRWDQKPNEKTARKFLRATKQLDSGEEDVEAEMTYCWGAQAKEEMISKQGIVKQDEQVEDDDCQ